MQAKVFAYLLGELTEEEQIRLESEYFSDEEKFSQFQAAQDDLLDAYTNGALSELQRQHFEEHFMASSWRRGRLEFAQALAEYVALPQTGESASHQTTGKPALWQSIKASLFPAALAWRVALTATALLVVVGSAWLMFEVSRLKKEMAQLQERQTIEQSQQQQTEKQIVEERHRAAQLALELEQQKLESARLENLLAEQAAKDSSIAQPAFISIFLTPQSFRDANNLKRLVIPANAQSVKLQLSFTTTELYKNLRAEIQTAEGNKILTQDRLKSRRTGESQVLSLVVRASLFSTNDYRIKLEGLAANGEYESIANYSFRVAKP